jgi:hypothetical protein
VMSLLMRISVCKHSKKLTIYMRLCNKIFMLFGSIRIERQIVLFKSQLLALSTTEVEHLIFIQSLLKSISLKNIYFSLMNKIF